MPLDSPASAEVMMSTMGAIKSRLRVSTSPLMSKTMVIKIKKKVSFFKI